MIRQREENIALAGKLKDLIDAVEYKEDDWKDKVQEAEGLFSEEVIETLRLVGKDKSRQSQNYQDALKLLNARVNNLETNLHIEIDMERIEDRSKALSYIGIEVADALKVIPKPVEVQSEQTVVEEVKEEKVEEKQVVSQVVAIEEEKKQEQEKQQIQEYKESITFDKKPSLWQKFKNSKLVKAVSYIFKIRVRIELPNALPEGKGE